MKIKEVNTVFRVYVLKKIKFVRNETINYKKLSFFL